MAEATYDERYCAFIDILGFQSLIDSIHNKVISYEEVRRLLRIVRQLPQRHELSTCADLRISSVSDAIVMSAAHNHLGFQEIIYKVYLLTFQLLYDGYFIRGAICKGRLFHDDEMVFGEALIKAFNLEQTLARFPRTILTSDVVRDIYKAGIIGGVSNMIEQADDGPHYINIFRQIRVCAEAQDIGNWAETLNYSQIAKHLRRLLKETADVPNHYEKVRWFAREWNRSIEKSAPRIKRVLGISGGGLVP